MAKKKKRNIELSSKEILFSFEETPSKVIRFYPHNMTVDIVQGYSTSTHKEHKNIPFAHLPKSVKKIIKPN